LTSQPRFIEPVDEPSHLTLLYQVPEGVTLGRPDRQRADAAFAIVRREFDCGDFIRLAVINPNPRAGGWTVDVRAPPPLINRPPP